MSRDTCLRCLATSHESGRGDLNPRPPAPKGCQTVCGPCRRVRLVPLTWGFVDGPSPSGRPDAHRTDTSPIHDRPPVDDEDGNRHRRTGSTPVDEIETRIASLEQL